MGTKTITIMEDAYEVLIKNKLENESFSDEIRRIFAKKKKKDLKDFFGILSEEEGEYIVESLEKKRAKNRELKKIRLEKEQ